MQHSQWRVIDSTYVIDSPYIRLRKDAVELPNGSRIDDYYVREGPDFAVIFALTPDRRVPLVRQFKYGIGRTQLELPAGMLDGKEEPAAAAARELAEETGFVARSIEHVATYAAGATNSNISMHLFFARDAEKKAEQKLDPGENIEVQLVSLDELFELTRAGEIEQMAPVAAIYEMLVRLEFLRRS